MANIDYKSIQNFKCSNLERLSLSVEWSSGRFPEKLALTMRNFKTIYLTRDEDKLAGMICATDDGVINVYIYYSLVNSDYQGYVIGRKLVQMVKEKYKSFIWITVIGYNKEINLYENCGFIKSENCSPLFVTSLWTQSLVLMIEKGKI